jgi:hypothetical protein
MASWWIDNLWSLRQRHAVLTELVSKNPEELTGVETLMMRSIAASEVITGELRGFVAVEGDAAVSYCYQDEGVRRCTSGLQKYVVKAIGPPVSLRADTGDVYGLLVVKEDNCVFKIMNKDTGRAGGAECGTSSNLPGKQEIIRKIHAQIRTSFPASHPIHLLLLDDRVLSKEADEARQREAKLEQDAIKERYEPSKKGAGSALDIHHIHSLNLKQICSYIEFLLRWLERTKPSGAPRVFLSAVEYLRAVNAEEDERKASDAAKPKRIRVPKK